jgi:ATP-dependent DNA helicase RecQ
MYAFCQDAVCRHRALVTYFGQPYEAAGCAACDVCLAETVQGTDTAAIVGKILGGAAELRGRFGVTHVADVLCGAATGRIDQLGHHRLDAYGSLRGEKKSQVRAWIDQLVARGLLARSDDEYPTLLITQAGHAVLRGDAAAAPLTIAGAAPARRPESRPAPGPRPGDAGDVPDAEIFETLRALRKRMAEERGVPPYLIFSDASLRDMARARPRTLDEFRQVKGVGDWKLQTFGDRFVTAVRQAVGAG